MLCVDCDINCTLRINVLCVWTLYINRLLFVIATRRTSVTLRYNQMWDRFQYHPLTIFQPVKIIAILPRAIPLYLHTQLHPGACTHRCAIGIHRRRSEIASLCSVRGCNVCSFWNMKNKWRGITRNTWGAFLYRNLYPGRMYWCLYSPGDVFGFLYCPRGRVQDRCRTLIPGSSNNSSRKSYQ